MDPIKVAFVGVGRRAREVYFRFLPKLRELFELVAVCDPLPTAADEAGERLGVPAFHSLAELVRARPMEAVIYATPFETHHAVSLYLSRHGLHHVCETPMAATLGLCREMISEARANGVVLHVNEQFFRLPLMAFARRIAEAGVIGKVHRITFYHGHTGYHNNSTWQLWGGGPPDAVNALTAAMGLRRHLDGAGRWQESETFRLHVLHFGEKLLVVDLAGNVKSAMGRCPRPGYLEIDGTEGTLVGQPSDRPAPWVGRAEVRLVDEADYARGGYAQSYPIERVAMVGHRAHVSERLSNDDDFTTLRCRLPERTLEYANPMLEWGIENGYLSAVARSLLDFHRQVRQSAAPEFSTEQAAASAEMELGFARSAAAGGGRVELPLEPDEAGEQRALARLREKLGADPADVEAMMNVVVPKTYVPEAAQE